MKNRMRSLSLVLLGAVLAWLVACRRDAPTAPRRDPGPLVLDLSIPAGGLAGVIVEISGGPVDSLRSPHEVGSAVLGADRRRLLIRGMLEPGVAATIFVPDRNRRSLYVVQLREAAERVSYAQRDVSSMSGILRRPQP